MAHSPTTFLTDNALTLKKWSDKLAHEAAIKSYFSRFIGTSKEHLIMVKDELSKGKGDKVTFGLRMKLGSPGVEGDATFASDAAAGTGSEALTFYSDSILIDQLRKQTKSIGKMSEQRVPYNIRMEGIEALGTWWAEEMDENFFYYLSGGYGTDTLIDGGSHHPITWTTGRAGNTPRAATNIIYGGNATSAASIDATDVLDLAVIEKAVAKAEVTDPMIQPFRVNGTKKFVCLMHTFQAYDLRTATSDNDWLEIHKATDVGKGGMMYANALGEYSGVIMHKHRGCMRYSAAGSYGVPSARALFLGAQAGVIGYGQAIAPTPGDLGTKSNKGRYNWVEESSDANNALAITAGTIFGIQKTQFNSKDFGVMSIDTACASPF